ncbi:MAG: hypothetical protein ACPL7B_17755 [Candidatus Poribacteria bacterium]
MFTTIYKGSDHKKLLYILTIITPFWHIKIISMPLWLAFGILISNAILYIYAVKDDR